MKGLVQTSKVKKTHPLGRQKYTGGHVEREREAHRINSRTLEVEKCKQKDRDEHILNINEGMENNNQGSSHSVKLNPQD